MTGDCPNWPNEEKMFKRSNCTGNLVAVHSVWTEMQCLDNCLRHPRCDKYIFNGQGNQNCKLLNTVDTAGVVNLPKTSGACAPNNTAVSVSTSLSPEAALIIWSAPRIATSWLAQHRKSAIHRLPVKSDKSVWLRTRNEYSAHAQRGLWGRE